MNKVLMEFRRNGVKGERLFKNARSAKFESEFDVVPGDVLDTDIGPVVVAEVDEDSEKLVLVNTDDQTLEVSVEELVEINPDLIEMTPDEVYELTAEPEGKEKDVEEKLKVIKRLVAKKEAKKVKLPSGRTVKVYPPKW